jgi:hypothetical protein
MKINKQQAKGISKQLGRSTLEQSEHCVLCLQETDISNLNLHTGVCTTCRPNTVKLDNKKIKELLGLYDRLFSRE